MDGRDIAAPGGTFSAADAFRHFKDAVENLGDGKFGYVSGFARDGDIRTGLTIEVSGGFFGRVVNWVKQLISWGTDNAANREIKRLFKDAVERQLGRVADGEQKDRIRQQLNVIANPSSGWPLDMRKVAQVVADMPFVADVSPAQPDSIARQVDTMPVNHAEEPAQSPLMPEFEAGNGVPGIAAAAGTIDDFLLTRDDDDNWSNEYQAGVANPDSVLYGMDASMHAFGAAIPVEHDDVNALPAVPSDAGEAVVPASDIGVSDAAADAVPGLTLVQQDDGASDALSPADTVDGAPASDDKEPAGASEAQDAAPQPAQE